MLASPATGGTTLAPGAAVTAGGVATVVAGTAATAGAATYLSKAVSSSGGDDGVNRGNLKVTNDKELKRQGVDAHQVKRDELGRKAKISEWDIATDNSGNAYMVSKDGKQVRDLGGTLKDLAGD
jgi:hypothetical protein